MDPPPPAGCQEDYADWTADVAWRAWQARSSRDGSGVTEEALAEAIQQEWTDEFEHPSPMACQAARVSLRMMGGEK